MQVVQLRDSMNNFIDSNGVELVKALEDGISLLIDWVNFLESFKKTGTADELLAAVASTIRETAACIALGLVRPAMFSMRTQIDLILAWLYFKDHPVEWRVVNKTGDGFKLKKELFDYLTNTVDGFAARYGILKQTSTRSEVDTYRLLSAHIHGQSSLVLPVIDNLTDAICSRAMCDEAILLIKELSEYVGDVLYSVYASEYAVLPGITQSIKKRFQSGKQQTEFYATA
nr:hypothetical protein [uncultured Deefgea sp.]